MENWLINFFETQLQNWSLAKENYKKLTEVKIKPFVLGDFFGRVQYNPARALSTLAKLDGKSLSERKCFLCKKNRPEEQLKIDISSGWELLVNPFPILPYHFTISCEQHVPQKLMLSSALDLAYKMKGMVIFFNDEGAGASAPDHCHYQAVRFEDLPLIKLIDDNYDKIPELRLPFKVFNNLAAGWEKYPVNAYFWNSNNEIRNIYIPRKSHRPSVFFKEGAERRAFSPGSIDMAGIMVTPFEEDFNKVKVNEIEEIYREVGIEG